MTQDAAGANWSDTYRERRNRLRNDLGGGVVLWLGHLPQPRNYADNIYPFRQNSNFLYYTGLDQPDMALLSYPEQDYDVLFARPAGVDDIVWSGPGPDRVELARRAGIDTVEDISRLGVYLTKAQAQGQQIHYLPPYQASSLFRIAELLVIEPNEVPGGVSERLREIVALQRSIKTDLEVAEIEDGLQVSARMHKAAMAAARPGKHEYDIAGLIQGIALSCNRQQAYIPIVTIHGEVLHNHSYAHPLEEGQLLLIDAGAESPMYYASDITRTFPVGCRFTGAQADVYDVVLQSQLAAIAAIHPDIAYREVHLLASTVIAEGLKSIGLMRGNAADAVEAGAHALFFPHGIGHMLGLDVHDMEDLGDLVGYSKGQKRSSQFGLNFLRLAKSLQEGFVLTVEPGVYFIPALIDRWQSERKHREFIDYDRVNEFRGFGGIRTEDNVVVTCDGCRVLGPGVPKTRAEVETACAAPSPVGL